MTAGFEATICEKHSEWPPEDRAPSFPPAFTGGFQISANSIKVPILFQRLQEAIKS